MIQSSYLFRLTTVRRPNPSAATPTIDNHRSNQLVWYCVPCNYKTGPIKRDIIFQN